MSAIEKNIKMEKTIINLCNKINEMENELKKMKIGNEGKTNSSIDKSENKDERDDKK